MTLQVPVPSLITIATALCFIACDTTKVPDHDAVTKTLQKIGTGAATYHQSKQDGGDRLRVYPKGDGCGAAVDQVWEALQVSDALKPEGVEFCYRSTPDAKAFNAWAKIGDETLCIRCSSSDGQPVIGVPLKDKKCP